MNVLVTGAGGYLGRGVVTRLCDCGVNVFCLGSAQNGIDSRAEIVGSDCFDCSQYESIMETIDLVIHMTWRNGFVHNDRSHIDDLPKHVRFLEYCASKGVSRIAVMGSVHEVGFYEGCVSELTPCNPQSYYGIAKNALRAFAGLICEKQGISLQWLRGYYIVGNEAVGSSIFSKISAASQKGEKSFPFTSGQNLFDFLDYGEFCDLVCSAVLQEEVNGIIEICSGKPLRLSERVESFINQNKYEIKLAYGQFPDRPYDSKAIWGDRSKLDRILERQSGGEQ